MDTINGITFEDWACACGNIAQGMSETEICNILGVETPIWQDTNDKWANKLGDLMAADMSVATKYGEIFANPKQGKFANSGGAIVSLDELLNKVPDYDAYKKISWHQSKASEVGIDPVSVLQEYGFDLQSWSQLNMHYMEWHNNYMKTDMAITDPEEYNKRYKKIIGIEQKWQDHWNKHYAENKADLGGDIEF